jgi:GT2 family glycosyltransferase
MKLSIIIVAYKCKEQLEVTLDAVFASQVDFNYEVIVLDNNSVDGTVELINQKYLSNPIVTPYLTFIENQENLGFPVANNMGLKQTSGQFVLFLNPDTKVDKNNLQTMVAFMEGRPEVGIATCKLIKPDGSLDPASRRGEPSPKTNNLSKKIWII